MQPTQNPPDLNRLWAVWERFITTGQLTAELDPLVVGSWQRCAPRLNPTAPPNWSYLNDEVLALTLRRHQLLIAIARPIIEDVLQAIESDPVMLLLLDSTACVLDLAGHPSALELAARLGVRRGAYLMEGRLGTTAFGIALTEGCPAQVVGSEHFLSNFHGLSDSAAPIFDLEGHMVGAVGLLTAVEHHDSQALGIVVAAARAFENQLHADVFVQETNVYAAELNATLNAISDGVLAWNARGILTLMNQQAGALLGLNPSAVTGHPLSESLTLPEKLARATARGEEITDEEINFAAGGSQRECLLSLRVIRDAEGKAATFIATLRRIDQVRHLVHRQVGAQAYLTLDDLIGDSPAMRQVRRQALAAANARTCVLLYGEGGTGKSVLARAIHNGGQRADGPFLAINCRAIPRELVLGEFLGFEAGAFNTAASSGQPSKFELAQNGTLFLEEVDALPLEMQAALLRVIEMADVIRLGGARVIPVDVRVIASCNGPLEQRVAEGAFHADLLFRLRSFVITLPPLRTRPEDVPQLIDRRLERLHRQLGRSIAVSAEAYRALCEYPWPGNVREVEAVLERAALLADGPLIQLVHLPEAVRERRVKISGEPLTEPVRSLAEAEIQAILSAVKATRGNLSQAARLLGIGRTTLWRRMRETGISFDAVNEDYRKRGVVSK